MSLFGIFCLNPVTKTFRDVLNICYSNNIKMWMKNCACCNHYIMLQWLLFPIPIIILLHRATILCLDKSFTRRNNFPVNCCIILQHVCLWYKLNNIKSICCCVRCVNVTILTISNEWGHMITHSVKNNLMYILKGPQRCWLWWLVNNIPIFIWSKNWPVSTIGDRLVVCLFLWRYTRNTGLTNNWCTWRTGTWYAAICTYEMT